MRTATSLILASILASSAAIAEDMTVQQPHERRAAVGLRLGYLQTIPQAGAEATYALRQDTEVGVSYAAGKTDISSAVEDKDMRVKELELRSSMAKVFGRFYPAQNSFFVSGGLGYRTIGAKADWEDRSGNQKFTMDRDALTLNLGIGNLWKWDNGFQIGADWLEAAIPVHHTRKNSSYSHSSRGIYALTGEKNRKSVEDTGEKIGKMTTLQIMFNMGYSF